MGLATILSSVLLATLAIIVTPPLIRLVPRLIRSIRTPINDLPGPEGGHPIWGHLRQISAADALVLHEKWVEMYGPVIKYKMMLGQNRLMMMDNRALNHILSNSSIYQKPQILRRSLGRLLGQGVLFAEGEPHRQQRRILNPAFGPVYIRELTDIFLEKSGQLREFWTAEITNSTNSTKTIDVIPWLNKMTLDIIGLAGFNYAFDALTPDDHFNELNDAVRKVLTPPNDFPIFEILKTIFPILEYIPSQREKEMAHARATMMRIGQRLIAEKKAFILAEAEREGKIDGLGAQEKNRVTREHVKGKDLLSLLVKANMATDLPDNLRLSDEDVLAQVPTFLIAGHETTSTAVTWALMALSEDQACQDKLRAELLSVASDTPTMDDLSALEYLDHVVRETMRVHSPVTSTIRMATQDDAIPTEHEWTDRHGVRRREVRVIKGDTVFIPILAINRSKELWGEDAFEFKPERWDNPPEAVRAIPGVWGNNLAFLGGARACIGYRFSLIEMKAILFTLVRAFEFKMAVSREEIAMKSSVVRRPFLKKDLKAGPQLPLLVSLVK